MTHFARPVVALAIAALTVATLSVAGCGSDGFESRAGAVHSQRIVTGNKYLYVRTSRDERLQLYGSWPLTRVSTIRRVIDIARSGDR